MLEFDFHVLILHLMSSYSCVNNPMHIPANYSCDSRTVIIDKTRDLHMIIFTFSISILKLSHEVYLHLHMCSLLSLLNMCYLLYLLNMCSLLKCEYLFCNESLSFFVILRLELHVCIMLTFMFCEINNIYIHKPKMPPPPPPQMVDMFYCLDVTLPWFTRNSLQVMAYCDKTGHDFEMSNV